MMPAFPAGRVLAAAPWKQLTGENVFDHEEVPAKSFPVRPRRATRPELASKELQFINVLAHGATRLIGYMYMY
jgi:hypothetical protein